MKELKANSNLNVKNEEGITESLKVADILGTAITSVVNADTNNNGKVETLEVLNGLQVVAFKAISNRPDLKAFKKEALDYDETEKAKLSLSISNATNFPSKKTDALVDRGLSILIELIDFIIDANKPASEF